MGLKTNKTTKTSRLNCQYVGSFSVKDGDRALTISEQNKFVDAKLKNCAKKLLNGMPVCLQVSPDGVEVLTSDEKTVKMAHTLRRVSYATVESVNKLFAYVTHQPGTDMEVVCHTFVTKKKDHAEELSAALGKLFKQTFAYTLKRRDKLEEAAQKRGANRRWAKQQMAEGHNAVKNGRNMKARSVDVNELGKESAFSPRAQQKASQNMAPNEDLDIRPRRRPPPAIPQNRSTSHESVTPLSSTSADVHQFPNHMRRISSPTIPSEWQTPFSPQNLGQSSSSVNDFAFTPGPNEDENPPDIPTSPRPTSSCTQTSYANQKADHPPELPSRNFKRRSSAPSSPQEVVPPALPAKRNASDSSIGFKTLGSSDIPLNTAQNDFALKRKRSAPLVSMPPSTSHVPVRAIHSSDSTIQASTTHRSACHDFENAAAVLLATADDTPPPLPSRGRQTVNQPPLEIREEEIGADEDEELRRRVRDEPRLSLTLEDEDWYIPGVSREIVVEMLESSDVGTFFVRDSQSRPGCYALTMKVIKSENNPTGFGNYLIAPERDGFALQGFDKVFPDISTLIRHYASYDDGLPCRLVLAGSNPLFHDSNGYLVEFMDEDDEKYAALSSCTSIFQELNMSDPW